MTFAQARTSIHPPQVAGMFYPDDAASCAAMVAHFIDTAETTPVTAPKIVVAPHAGYVYSGAVAGAAYRLLAARRDIIRRVVLIGPAHRAYVDGMATTSGDAWQTPLGAVPVDTDALARLSQRADITVNDAAFRGEHSLEVQLPFLQTALRDFTLVPILAGNVAARSVADLIETLWGGPETVIVISSDLSHFHDYDTARRLDLETTRKIEVLDTDLGGEEACGCRGLAGALIAARRHDLRVTALDLRNSGDTAGDKSRVVGYGAFAMEDAETARLGAADRQTLLEIVSRALARAVETRAKPVLEQAPDRPLALTAPRATFVTLKIDGALRGCVGSIVPQHPLIEDVVDSAYKAGFTDRRFDPLGTDELPRLTIGISILSHPRRIAANRDEDLLAQLRPGRDGLIIEDGRNRALFLPSVWEMLPAPRDFLTQLKRKAGLPDSYWSPETEARRFTTESFEGPFVAPASVQ